MCKPASMIVTKQKVFWSEKTDSHHEIISEFGIRETDARGYINVVPIEIYPENGNLGTPISKWKFSVDYEGYGRDLPDWFDKANAEKECRSAVKYWKKQKVITGKRKELTGGQYYLVGNAVIEKVSNCTLDMRGNSTVNDMRGNSTVNDMWGNSTVNDMRGNSTVKYMWGNSTVNDMWDNSTVNDMKGNSTVIEIYGECCVTTYHSLDMNCLKSSRAVVIDRSGNKVVCRTGK